MSEPPKLTDPAARRNNIARATEMVLQDLAADDVEDRLALVNKSFQRVAIVTPFADVWRWRMPDAQILPDDDVLGFGQGEFDLVVHSLGLHWSNDPVGQMIQCHRALAPNGLFLCATLGGQTLTELRSVLAQAEVALTGGLSPRVAPMAEIRDLGALLQRAGFALPVADNFTQMLEYPSVTRLMRDLRAMGEANALDQRLRRPTARAVFSDAEQLYRQYYGEDAIRATFEFVVLTGWAPDASQPKPKRPGSATQRLADALGSTETKLPI